MLKYNSLAKLVPIHPTTIHAEFLIHVYFELPYFKLIAFSHFEDGNGCCPLGQLLGVPLKQKAYFLYLLFPFDRSLDIFLFLFSYVSIHIFTLDVSSV